MKTRFSMCTITVPQFAIIDEINSEEEISLTTSVSFEYSNDEKLIGCSAEFNFKTKGRLLIKLICKCDFKIHPDDWKEITKDNHFSPSRELLEYFAVQTIGTSRGILFCKLENTLFSGLIIPPINVKNMMENLS